MHASLNVGYQDKSGPGKIHEVILVSFTFSVVLRSQYPYTPTTEYLKNRILGRLAVGFVLTVMFVTKKLFKEEHAIFRWPANE